MAEAKTGDSFEIAPVSAILSYTYSWKYNESGVKTATLNAFSVSDAQMIIGRTYRVTFRLTGPDLSPNVVGTGSCNIPVSYTHLDVYKRQAFLLPVMVLKWVIAAIG